jgi:hypothetical protein
MVTQLEVSVQGPCRFSWDSFQDLRSFDSISFESISNSIIDSVIAFGTKVIVYPSSTNASKDELFSEVFCGGFPVNASQAKIVREIGSVLYMKILPPSLSFLCSSCSAWKRLVVFASVMCIMYSAYTLSRSINFYYSSATFLGVLILLVSAFIILYRFVRPLDRPILTLTMGLPTYLSYYIFNSSLKDTFYNGSWFFNIPNETLMYSILFAMSAFSFAFAYWRGPPSSRTLDIFEWLIRGICVLLLFFLCGSHVRGTIFVFLVVGVIHGLHLVFSLLLLWKRLSRPLVSTASTRFTTFTRPSPGPRVWPQRPLSATEYAEQGRNETWTAMMTLSQSLSGLSVGDYNATLNRLSPHARAAIVHFMATGETSEPSAPPPPAPDALLADRSGNEDDGDDSDDGSDTPTGDGSVSSSHRSLWNTRPQWFDPAPAPVPAASPSRPWAAAAGASSSSPPQRWATGASPPGLRGRGAPGTPNAWMGAGASRGNITPPSMTRRTYGFGSG